jgi:hypothetical protein
MPSVLTSRSSGRAGIALAACSLALAATACAARPDTATEEPTLVLAPASGPLDYTPRPTTSAITADDLRSRLYAFADDSMLGRETGALGGVKAADFIAAELARLGLEPAGENGTWFQTVPILMRPLDSTRTALAVDGRTLALWTDWAPIPPTPAIPFSGAARFDVPVIFGGRAGDPRSMISAEQAEGKLVVLLPAVDQDGRLVVRFYEQPGMERFARAAAVAVVQLELAPATSLATARRVRGGLADPDAPPHGYRPGGMYLTRQAAEALLGKPLAQAKPGDAGRRASGAAVYREDRLPFPARNVIAVLRGTDPARREQYIAVGAHLDHLGIGPMAVDHDSLAAWLRVYRPIGANGEALPESGERRARFRAALDSVRRVRPPRRDSIYNGADDDGSGSMTVLEVAEALAAEPRPRRSILLVWHTGEEKGLYGSEWFTTHPTVPRDSIVANINMDMVGRGDSYLASGGGRPHLQAIGTRRLSTQLGDLVDSVNARMAQPLGIDYSFDAPGHPLNRYCRSDHWNYARFGIPVAFLSLGYGSDYHQLSDEPQYIRYDHMTLVARLVHDVALAAAQRPERLVVDKPKPADPRGTCRQ